MTLPLTIADWALGEKRFRDHYREVFEDDDLVAFHEFLAIDPGERAGRVPFIHTVDGDRRLPATYANFLVINEAVLLPVYGIYKQILLGQPWGSNPMSDAGLWFFLLGTLVMAWNIWKTIAGAKPAVGTIPAPAAAH